MNKITQADEQRMKDLYNLQHCSIEQIARIYSVSKNAVKYHLFKDYRTAQLEKEKRLYNIRKAKIACPENI